MLDRECDVADYRVPDAAAADDGASQKGIIINLTSPVGWSDTSAPGLPGKGGVAVTYGTTKAALHRFTHNLAKETKLHNIASIILDPGFAVTERMQVQTASRGGIPMAGGHTADVPGVAVRYICTCPDPLVFNGKMIYSPGLRSGAFSDERTPPSGLI